jgi:hypothetical protein
MLSILLACSASFSVPIQEARSGPVETRQEGWDAVAGEYESAFEAWAGELSRTGAFEKPESERPPSPAVSFWPRFEALAERGEGRAVLWMLDNAQSGSGDELQLRRKLFERVRAAGEAEWVASALPRLGTQGIEEDVRAYLGDLQAESRPKAIRVAARLAEASLVQEKEPARAADLRLRAALVECREVELAPDEALAPEDLDEICEALIKSVDEAQSGYFDVAYYQGKDGTYYPHASAPPDPETTWKPVVGAFAEQGCTRARIWALSNADWQPSEPEKTRLCGYLDALCKGPLTEDELSKLGGQTSRLIYKLGIEAVEPRARELIEKSEEKARPGMLFELGEALCEVAKDDAAREKGLALLRQVTERWPTSDVAKSAAALVFRYTNLVVGKTSPDFEAVDVDGNAFKLSDYRGKVTVVDFWGFW